MITLRLAGLLSLAALLSAQTLETCRQSHRRGNLEEADRCYLALSASKDPYLRAEANWALDRYQEANEAFKEALKAQPKNPDYRVRMGYLYLYHEQKQDAVDLFEEALAIRKDHAGALTGLAAVASEGFDSAAIELAEKALAADPKQLDARLLLAAIALEDNNPRKAVEEADKALQVDPESLEALALKATVDLLDDKPGTPHLAAILKRNPAFGEVYQTAGRFFVLNRRYEEGIALYRKALELNPRLYKARAELGLNLMRLGHDAEAKQHLEACYRAGNTYPSVGNPLRLLDSYKNFRYIKRDNIVLKLHQREADLLLPYVEEELRRAISAYEKKYKFRLDRPVQLEIYPDHEDFAVRILGMPGMGALGVTFVNVVAMDSPSGRRPGEYHWASTLWHELSHVYTLAATRQRMPRWFTEGMAVYEETATSPEWGDRISPPVILAIRDKKLLPVAQLDRGFVHPSYPDQVVVSYFQAGRVCMFIERKWGFEKLLDMTRAFGQLKTTPEVVQEQLGMPPEEFDKQFLAWVEEQTRVTVEGFESWKKGMQRISELVKKEDHDQILKEAPAVRDLYPDYVEDGNLYAVLADTHLARGDKKAAAGELERYARAGGKNPASLKLLATLLEEQGKTREAAEALSRINHIYPRDEELHRRLGDLLLAAGDPAGAVREFQALVAMKPLDQAASYFSLARAYRSAGRPEEAKEQVLLSLEAAPGYRPAQKLLLELSQ
ncbi:MAG: tetratricopeptide repeat protein [Bryobacterales bacterium]|nr:tetratricopeptide repeat protein [Bryobacterales bacterium]